MVAPTGRPRSSAAASAPTRPSHSGELRTATKVAGCSPACCSSASPVVRPGCGHQALVLSHELLQALGARPFGHHHLVGRGLGASAVGHRDEHLARRKALRLAVGSLGPRHLGLHVHVKPVRLTPPGGSHVERLSGHAGADHGVGSSHCPALGGENGGRIPRLDVASHVGGGDQDLPFAVDSQRSHGAIVVGRRDDEAVSGCAPSHRLVRQASCRSSSPRRRRPRRRRSRRRAPSPVLRPRRRRPGRPGRGG